VPTPDIRPTGITEPPPQLYKFGSQEPNLLAPFRYKTGTGKPGIPALEAATSVRRSSPFDPTAIDGSNVARLYAPVAARGGGVKYGW
jgi:hypothetical protein